MKILVAASEAVPFCKTGGLADVVGSLARVLASRPGHRVALFLPLYRAVRAAPFRLEPVPGHFWVPIGEALEKARLWRAPWGGVEVFFVDHPKYFDRDELYGTAAGDFPDNDERFIFFCRGVLEGLKFVDIKPDVLHCQDWQSALIPAYLETRYHIDAYYARTASVLTVHNLAYQGQFTKDALFLAGFGWADFTPDKLEFYGGVNFLKAGLVYADALTTVSPTYSKEIQSAEFGRGLEGVLKHRSADLSGILNGLDLDYWNPSTDPHIAERYSEEKAAKGKAACKLALQKSAGLELAASTPLVGVVSRLDDQKGLDVAVQALDALLSGDLQLAAVGSGVPELQDAFQRLAERHPGKVLFRTGYDEPLAHQVYAASDLFLMPSRFEPCGLSQLIAMRYGSAPVVTRTGGLADTVLDASGSDEGFGFVAPKAEPALVAEALDRALRAFREPASWAGLVRRCMERDFSWERSAGEYLKLFDRVVKKASER